MANLIVTEAELSSVAGAIRTRGGTQAQLQWPAGFVAAVEAITPQMAAADNGKVVVPDGEGGYELQAQTERTVTDLGTYTTTTNDSVIVNIPAAAGNSY